MQEPGYFGTPNRGHLPDATVWEPIKGFDSREAGPFDSEEQLHETMVRRLSSITQPAYTSFLRDLISATLRGHKPVFTHGDLQLKNILARRAGLKEDGSTIFELKYIDWEFSGWYPEYWEFCNATMAARFNPEWLEMYQRILPVYHQEYLMMQHIRSILFY